MKVFKLIVSGGGTGGHIYPAISIASLVKLQQKDADILFIGALGKMEMDKVPKAGFSIRGLWISGFQRSLSLRNFLFPLKLVVSLLQAFLILKKFKPQVVMGTGGFASGPVLKVAQWLKIKTLIQEQNSFPGITNRLLAKKADKIFVAYNGMENYFPSSKISITGNPIRPIINEGFLNSKKAKSFFGLDPEKKTLLIIGGSLGAKKINELIASQIKFFKQFSLNILWQCGTMYFEIYKNFSSKNLVVKPFVYDIEELYSSADYIISRAGAGSLSELSCVGKPILLIPSPNVTANHQFHNAMSFAKVNAALVIEEKDLDEKFQDIFTEFITDTSLQIKMCLSLKALARPHATKAIVNEMIELI